MSSAEGMALSVPESAMQSPDAPPPLADSYLAWLPVLFGYQRQTVAWSSSLYYLAAYFPFPPQGVVRLLAPLDSGDSVGGGGGGNCKRDVARKQGTPCPLDVR